MAREQFHRKLTAALKHNDELQIQMRMSGSFHRPPPTNMMSGIPQSQSFGSRPISPTAQQHQQQQQQRPMSPSMQRSNSIIATNASNNSSSHEIAVGSGMNQALLAKKSAATAAVSNGRKAVSPDNHLDHNPNAVSPSSSAWRRQSMPMMDTTGGEKQQQIPTFNTEYFEPLDPRMQQQLQMPPITTSTSTQRPFSAQHHHHQQQFAPQDDSFYFAQQQQRQSRPNTTGRHHRHRHQSSAGLHSQKNLNRVLTKITHHSGKKVQWSAERLSDLLDSCGDWVWVRRKKSLFSCSISTWYAVCVEYMTSCWWLATRRAVDPISFQEYPLFSCFVPWPFAVSSSFSACSCSILFISSILVWGFVQLSVDDFEYITVEKSMLVTLTIEEQIHSSDVNFVHFIIFFTFVCRCRSTRYKVVCCSVLPPCVQTQCTRTSCFR